jgi:hypothetical protein
MAEPNVPNISNVPGRPPGPHPTPEQLYRARRGPRTAEAERWLAHAAACASCTEELLLLEAFDEPDAVSPGRLADAWERFGQPAARPRQPEAAPLASVIPINPNTTPASPRPGLQRQRRARWMAPLGALAASIAAVAVFSVWTSTRPASSHLAAPPPGMRGGSGAAGTWLPAGLLDAPPSEIVFPAANGEAQRVTVFDAGHTYTWTSPPALDGRVLFPAGERQRLRKGVDYYWTVIGQEEMEAKSFKLR